MSRTIRSEITEKTNVELEKETKMISEYIKFMCNPYNYKKCDECPANDDCSSWPGNRLPCGQFYCWVEMHCPDYF